MAYRILYVDDDRTYTPVTQEYLESKGLQVSLYHSAEQGLAAFRRQPFDLCILDVKMPFKDGFTLAAELREIQPSLPFLFLTGQNSREDRIAGLQLGADDYVVKPYSVEELFLRITAILRRVKPEDQGRTVSDGMRLGSYRFHPDTRQLHGAKGIQRLSTIESQLLQMFLAHREGIVDRETALQRIWSDEHMLHGRSLNVYVSRLRKYLRDDPRLEILNIHGTGYKLVLQEGPEPQ